MAGRDVTMARKCVGLTSVTCSQTAPPQTNQTPGRLWRTFGTVGSTSPHFDVSMSTTTSKGTKVWPLHIAASTGDLAQIAKLLPTIPVNTLDSKGWSPLHYAASYGRPAAVKALLSAGADVNAADGQKRTPLHLAAAGGDAASVKELLAGKADSTKQDHLGRTPEVIARAYNHAAALTALTNSAPPAEHDLDFLRAYSQGRNVPELPPLDPNAKPRSQAAAPQSTV